MYRGPTTKLANGGKRIPLSVRERGVDHKPEEEFAEFYRTARDGCLRAVCSACGDLALAEDLTNEAFARAYMSWRKAVPALATAGILAASLSLAVVTQSSPPSVGSHALGYHGAVVNVDEAGFSIHTDAKTGGVTVTVSQAFDEAELKALLAEAGVPAAFNSSTLPSGSDVWWDEAGLPTTWMPKGAIVEPEMMCTWTGVSTLDPGNAIVNQTLTDGNDTIFTIYPSKMPAGSVLGFRYVTVAGIGGGSGISTTLLSGQPTGCAAKN